jgi:hypothetical protein
MHFRRADVNHPISAKVEERGIIKIHLKFILNSISLKFTRMWKDRSLTPGTLDNAHLYNWRRIVHLDSITLFWLQLRRIFLFQFVKEFELPGIRQFQVDCNEKMLLQQWFWLSWAFLSFKCLLRKCRFTDHSDSISIGFSGFRNVTFEKTFPSYLINQIQQIPLHGTKLFLNRAEV